MLIELIKQSDFHINILYKLDGVLYGAHMLFVLFSEFL